MIHKRKGIHSLWEIFKGNYTQCEKYDHNLFDQKCPENNKKEGK